MEVGTLVDLKQRKTKQFTKMPKTKTKSRNTTIKIARLQGRRKQPKGIAMAGKAMPSPSPKVGLSAKAEYRRLLFDPCAADLVEPPYLGNESGFLLRTRDVIVPVYLGTSLTAGNYDYFLQWSPGNLGPTGAGTNYGIITGGAAPNAAGALIAGYKSTGTAQINFINSASTPVQAYRVVACCVKFIPTGPPLSRQGMVALCNFPSPALTTASTPTFGDLETICPHPVNNGSEPHEIVWLPGTADQAFGALEASTLDPGFGTLCAALGSVDSTVNAGGTIATPNGRFEITTVWQWAPQAKGGVIQTISAPPKHTVNDVLAEVIDLGSKIYTGAKKVERGVVAVAHLLGKVL